VRLLVHHNRLLVAQQVLNVSQHNHHALHAHLLVVHAALQPVNLCKMEEGRGMRTKGIISLERAINAADISGD